MSLSVQIIIAAVWLVAYTAFSVLYHRRWDARLRAALGRRLGLDVRWARPDEPGAALVDGSTPAGNVWHADTDGPLGRQLVQAATIRTAQIAVMVLGGAVPALALIGLEFLLDFHAVVLLGSLVAIVAVFSLYWVGTYQRAARGA